MKKEYLIWITILVFGGVLIGLTDTLSKMGKYQVTSFGTTSFLRTNTHTGEVDYCNLNLPKDSVSPKDFFLNCLSLKEKPFPANP